MKLFKRSVPSDENKNNPIDWVIFRKSIEEDKLSENTIQFFFSQAEKMLDSTVEIGVSFQNRALAILTFLVPTLLSIFAFVALNLYQLPLTLPLICSACLLLRAAYLCLKIVNTKKSYIQGTEPSLIIHQEWLKSKKCKQLSYVALNECESYQHKINNRLMENDKLGTQFSKVTKILWLAPITAIFVFLGFFFFGCSFC
jgi:hypothetical protein